MEFTRRKEATIAKMRQDDRSAKQSVDIRAVPIIDLVNSHQNYVTTSSCSGRISIVVEGKGKDEDQHNSKGCWLYVSHDPVEVTCETIIQVLLGGKPVCLECREVPAHDYETSPYISFKCEPFILHVEAASSEHGHALIVAAQQAGYRNSGMIVSPKRCMVAVRHTMKLDVPIGYVCEHDSVRLMVTVDYLLMLTVISNKKLHENFERMEVLREEIEKALFGENDREGETKEERRIRKREEGLRKQQMMKG